MSDQTPAREVVPPSAANDEPMSAASPPVMVKPVSNAIRILRYLSHAGQPARAIQIARHLSINSSTCFNILRTLVAEGVVEFSPLSKTYSTGLGLVKLAQNTLTEGQRVSVVKPLLQELAARFGVTVSLWRRMGLDRIVLVALEHSPSDFRIHMTEGQQAPLLVGASGRAIAPHMGFDRAQIKTMFKSLRWQRPLSFETYWDEVQETRERGYAIDDGYFARGILSVGAAIPDPVTNSVQFAVTAVMFQGQYDATGVAEVGRELRSLAPRLGGLLL
jgi:DNA-binding IclR family transcriptional regulator